MALQESIQFHAGTDVGLARDHNEDNYLVDRKLALFMVADGMGGHAAGEVASALAVRIVHEEIRKERSILEDFASGASGAARVSVKTILNLFEYALQRACARIHEEAANDTGKRGMGTTMSALLVAGNRGFIAHVGDSRIYLARGSECRQITEDHTVFNELIKRGKLTRDQIDKVAQKNAITRALGVYERIDVDTLSFDLFPGDQLMLASDGLHSYLGNNDELREKLGELDGDVAVRSLIEMANERGGKDNITVVLVRVGEGTVVDDERAKKGQLKRDVLARVPLFARLTERELMRVMQVAEVRSYAPNDTAIREGDRGDQLFVVLSGTVRVSRGEAVLTTLGAGEHFGEMALIRNVPRSATVTSDGPSEMILIRRADFFDILRTEHELAVKLLWQFLGVLVDRLDQTSRDLRRAREEILAEDITDEIFPELDVEDIVGEDSTPAVPLVETKGEPLAPPQPVEPKGEPSAPVRPVETKGEPLAPPQPAEPKGKPSAPVPPVETKGEPLAPPQPAEPKGEPSAPVLPTETTDEPSPAPQQGETGGEPRSSS